MKSFSHIFLWLACAIMFLHNMTPHSHADHSGDIKSVIQDTANDSAEGWMQLLFSQDLGEGHLEFYKNSNAHIEIHFIAVEFLKHFPFDIGTGIDFKLFESLVDIHPPPDDQSLITHYFTSSLSLRGPPILLI